MSQVIQNQDFFILIVESQSQDDLYDNRSDGELLKKAVGLNQIDCLNKNS